MMNENDEKVIRVGSRKSELALIQTKHVISELQKLYPEKNFEIHTMSTIGDRILNVSLPKIGEKSLFTRDLEDALKHGRVDFIVHSLKDLPTALPSGMTIGAVLEREDCRDALVLNENFKGYTLQTLPKGSVIGTSSLRRTAQIRRKYPHLELCDIRGNLNTRLAKLDAANSKFAGIILAQAGLVRMGWMSRVSQILEPCDLLYCVGQGALAVECRSNDEETLRMLKHLMCLPTTCKILAERSFLKTLGGGCSAPVAVSCVLNKKSNQDTKILRGSTLSLRGAVWSLDGQTELFGDVICALDLGKRRKTEEYSTTEDEDDENLSPSKRIRIDEGSNKEEKKRSSPKVFSDDPVPENMADGMMPNLQYLIDVHGPLLQKCPFYAKHKKDKENGTTSANKEECPLKMPIGQDFMGVCPYVDTAHKVEISEKGICPVTGRRLSKISAPNNEFESKNENTIDNENSVKKSLITENVPATNHIVDKSNSNILKCPFSGKTISSQTANNHNKSSFKEAEKNNSNKDSKSSTLDENSNKNMIDGNVGHEMCPFLQKVKQIDHSDEGKSNEIIQRPLSPEMSEDECKEIFCGIFRHKCFEKIIFKKCDDLGRQLAQNLINKGALAIMKLAQNEIHDSINKKTT